MSEPTEPTPSAPIPLPLGTRRSTYGLLVGVVTAMLAVGLAIPAVVGERVGEQVATGNGTAGLDLDQFGGAASPDATDGSDAAGDGAGGSGTGAGSSAGGAGGAGSIGGGAAGGAATTTTAPGTVLTASDVGVTATEIKIGLLLPTSEDVGDPEAQGSAQLQYFQAYADEINEAGGIYGRKLVFSVAKYDLLDQEEGARTACLTLARDEKVFAAVNTTGFGPPGALCLTREHGVPFLQGSGHPDEVYAQSKGLYSSNFDSQTRNLRNMVWFLHQLKVLQGKKIGMLGSNWIGLEREQQEGIVDTLKALGYDPFVYMLSGDPVSAQTQIPIAVQQMRQNGVEVVLFGADFISGTSFVQQAEAQAYTPRYGAADPWGWSTDFVVSGMGASFNGAITVTAMRTYDARVGVPEAAPDAACREIYERRSGTKIDRANDDSALYVGSMWACGVMDRVRRAAEIAGPNLTRAGFAAAMGQLGTLDIPYAGGPGTFSPTKLDGANTYRPQQFDGGCRCWVPLVKDFAPGNYK